MCLPQCAHLIHLTPLYVEAHIIGRNWSGLPCRTAALCVCLLYTNSEGLCREPKPYNTHLLRVQRRQPMASRQHIMMTDRHSLKTCEHCKRRRAGCTSRLLVGASAFLIVVDNAQIQKSRCAACRVSCTVSLQRLHLMLQSICNINLSEYYLGLNFCGFRCLCHALNPLLDAPGCETRTQQSFKS